MPDPNAAVCRRNGGGWQGLELARNAKAHQEKQGDWTQDPSGVCPLGAFSLPDLARDKSGGGGSQKVWETFCPPTSCHPARHGAGVYTSGYRAKAVVIDKNLH